MFALIPESVSSFVVPHGVTIVAILGGAYLIHRCSHLVIENAIQRAIVDDDDDDDAVQIERRKREGTLVAIFEASIDVLVVIVATVMVLSELGINTGALLASFGIAGIAVGFGAQFLIKDLIAGFIVLLENQYRVGDVVCFNGTCGLVENISLRMTTLRDLDGTVHHVPNGEARLTSNLTKHHANVNVDVGVSYAEDLERVIEVINRIGDDLAADEAWRERIRSAPQFLRVERFDDSAVVLKILGETIPLEQWNVAGELRRRLKITFDREGIEIPLPQRVVYQVPVGATPAGNRVSEPAID